MLFRIFRQLEAVEFSLFVMIKMCRLVTKVGKNKLLQLGTVDLLEKLIDLGFIFRRNIKQKIFESLNEAFFDRFIWSESWQSIVFILVTQVRKEHA